MKAGTHIPVYYWLGRLHPEAEAHYHHWMWACAEMCYMEAMAFGEDVPLV
ncbi:hypothetical protein ACKF11_13530 [Methylobacillus sp. Pita2]